MNAVCLMFLCVLFLPCKQQHLLQHEKHRLGMSASKPGYQANQMYHQESEAFSVLSSKHFKGGGKAFPQLYNVLVLLCANWFYVLCPLKGVNVNLLSLEVIM